MLRAVVDPGVLIAGFISPRAAPAALLRAWRIGEFELIVSPALLDELLIVLLRDKFRRYLSVQQARDLVIEIGSSATRAEDPAERPRVSRDPKDDYLIALAHATKVDALVSGDRDLLDLPGSATNAVTARVFLDRLTASEPTSGSGV